MDIDTPLRELGPIDSDALREAILLLTPLRSDTLIGGGGRYFKT